MKYNLTAIRKLILEAYDDQELTVFCHDYFREVIERFGAGMSKSDKAFQLVTYCDRRGQLEALVDRIKAERPEKYSKYQAQLESGEEAPSMLEEIRAEASEYAEVFESASRAESHRKRFPTKTDLTQETDHPLTGSPQEIKRWFLEELGPDEQTFVVTAALFSGLERQELMDLYSGVLNVLRPPEAQVNEER
jgi:hypothetical protein